MRRLLLTGAVAIALTAAGYGAYLGRGRAVPAPPEPMDLIEDLRGETIIQLQPIPVDKQLAGQTGIVQMAVTDQGFEPRVLTAPIGGAVKVHLRNAGSQPHNFVLPRFGIVTSNLTPGSENYIEFTASQKGEWTFFSDAPGQEEPGLAGTLKVE